MTEREGATNTQEVAEVRAALQRFHDGYIKRDPQALEAFMADLFPADDDQLIVGTGSSEWFFDRAGSAELVGSDWESWGDVAFDVPGAHISVHGDVAWLAANATVTRTIPAESWHEGTLGYVKEIIEEGKGSVNERLMETFRALAYTIFETRRGDRFVWPLRLTGVLVKEGGHWRFRQLHFSHATTRAPDERILE